MQLEESLLSDKQIKFIREAFNKFTFQGKDIDLIVLLHNAIQSKFTNFKKPDVHILKQILDETAIKGNNARFLVSIYDVLEELLTIKKENGKDKNKKNNKKNTKKKIKRRAKRKNNKK